jgi:hypothetical protein
MAVTGLIMPILEYNPFVSRSLFSLIPQMVTDCNFTVMRPRALSDRYDDITDRIEPLRQYISSVSYSNYVKYYTYYTPLRKYANYKEDIETLWELSEINEVNSLSEEVRYIGPVLLDNPFTMKVTGLSKIENRLRHGGRF